MSISKSIVQGFIKGNEKAIEKVYLEYKNLMYFIIATYIDNQADCDDVLSSAFLKAIEHKEEIKPPYDLKSYLATIAKNEAINFLKKKKETINSEIVEELYGENDRTNLLLNDLETILTNKETIVLYLKIGFGYTWEEIKEITGIAESSARKMFSEAKEKLRKELL